MYMVAFCELLLITNVVPLLLGKKVISSLIKEFGYDLFEIISSEPELLNKVEMT